MTPLAAQKSIEAKIETDIGVGFGTDAIAWPGIPFDPKIVGSPQWVKVDFMWGASFQGTKGSVGINFTTGVLQLSCYEKKDKGDANVALLAETCRSTFNRLRLETDIVFEAPSGPRWSFEDSWRVATVSCPFTLHEGV